MAIQAYSLDQVVNTVYDTIASLRDGSSIWEKPPQKSYGSGAGLIGSQGCVDNFVTRSSKFRHYLLQSRDNGTLRDIREFADPLVASVFVKTPYTLLHDEWLSVHIYDLGTLAKIVNKEHPKVVGKYLPDTIRAAQMLYGQVSEDIGLRDIEVWYYYCHEDCQPVKKTITEVNNRLKKMNCTSKQLPLLPLLNLNNIAPLFPKDDHYVPVYYPMDPTIRRIIRGE